MNLKFQQSGSQAIVYDADNVAQPEARLLDASYWRNQNTIVGSAAGRGNALFLDTPFGPAVLRACLRGGWVAKVSRASYVFTGYRRSRPIAEARLLETLFRAGLPVPRPLLAVCERKGLLYSGSLLTARIMDSKALGDLLGALQDHDDTWSLTGQCIRRFHDVGLVHPDLNACNILVSRPRGEEERIYLIDFDRAYIHPGASRKFRSNLDRLNRSLLKLWPAHSASSLDACWGQLMNGYNGHLAREDT